MKSCEEIAKSISELAALSAADVPAATREHLMGCPACTRVMAVARLRRGLLAAAANAPEPPVDFAERVLGTLAARRLRRPEAEMWRLGWGLVPAFAATVAFLLILFHFQPSTISGSPMGLFPMEGLSAGEQLVLETGPPEPDAVLTAVMEGGGT